MNKLIDNPAALTSIIRRIAIEAGEIILKYYDGLVPNDITKKGDGSPVSEADKAAERHIQSALKDLLPDIPFVGEEAFSENRADDIGDEQYFWLVDALDGTKEFISGGDDFTVNIALIHGRNPFLGVVYAPVTETTYAGHSGTTALKHTPDMKNDKIIHVRNEPANGIVVVGSKSHGSGEKLDHFLEQFKVRKLVKRGSSLKICTIAEGRADLYPRVGPTCEWDIAAGHAVLKAAGGFITTVDGHELTYNKAYPKMLNPEFIASSFEWYDEE